MYIEQEIPLPDPIVQGLRLKEEDVRASSEYVLLCPIEDGEINHDPDSDGMYYISLALPATTLVD